jgi:hypothetical protein
MYVLCVESKSIVSDSMKILVDRLKTRYVSTTKHCVFPNYLKFNDNS